MFDVDLDVSPDRLEQVLLADEQLIARIRIRQAKVLAALDVAQVPLGDGAGTLAEWTRARLDVTDSTARDLVTAARTMLDQPVVQDLVEVGAASFDRLVATSRLVASGADPETVSESFRYDLNGVVRLRERHRAISRKDEAQAFRDRYLVLQPSLDGSRGTIRGELPAIQFMTVEEALTRTADQFRRLPGPRVARWAAMADALTSQCEDALQSTGRTDSDGGGGREPLVSVMVDADLAAGSKGEAAAEIVYGPRVGPLVLERILCEGRVELIGLQDGRPITVSDATRAIPPVLRRFVAWRDGGCSIDGCTSRYRLQVHHIRHRADGGDHDPANLALLCWFHHHVVIHGMGLELDSDSPPQRRRFLRPSCRGPSPRGPDPP